MQFSSSDHYLWNNSDFLGKGATGVVYKGRDRNNGNLVAIKVFNNENRSFWRELDILRHTPIHNNIVRFITMEMEFPVQRRVIVMELCTGGSLYSIIDKPENGFGLIEDELLCVIRDVVSGLNHLHQHEIVHRDIKPGNIMRYIANDGSHIYKLVDFGAARQLDPQDTFISLYGTEEYLHPDMYERAVLKKNKGKTFNGNVDLWSIGATFYHVITGKLPFRPYLGRSDQTTMFRMTGEKKSGVISAYQEEQNGKILWETEFPDYTSSSAHLRNSLRIVLAGILESNAENCMTFQNFVDCIHTITSSSCITIFCLYNSSFLRIYANSRTSDWFSHLKDEVSRSTRIPPSKQIYFFANKQYIYSIEEGIPVTTMDQPFFLITTTVIISPAYFACPPDLNFHNESLALEKDCQIAKNALVYVNYYHKTCKNIDSFTLHIENTASRLLSAVLSELSAIQTVLNTSKQVLNKLKLFENVCKYLIQSLRFHSPELTDSLTSISRLIQNVQLENIKQSSKISKAINEFESLFDGLEKFSMSPFYSISPRQNYIVAEKQFIIHLESIKDASQCFNNDCKRNISNDLQKDNHKFFVKQVDQAILLSKLLFDQLKASHIEYHRNFIKWFQTEIEEKLAKIHDLSFNIKEIEEFNGSFSEIIEVRLSEIFTNSLVFVESSKKGLAVEEIDTHGLSIPIWKSFILEAGPSILSLERLALALSDLPS